MLNTNHLEYTKYIALFLLGIYMLNLAYLKLTADGLIDPFQNFGGLDQIQQVILMFVMCFFYVVFVVYREQSMDRGT